GRSGPTPAVATGVVIARQRDRMIRARDRLAVDFSTEQRRVAVTDNASDDGATADNAPDGAQLASSQVSSDEPPASVNTALRTETRMTRLKAFGEVSVVDPTEGVDLSAQTLDCTFGKDGAIERATVRGTADEPASVRLNTMTVTGEVVHVDVGNEWAEVPSGGRMTFPSRRDLDGRRLDRPIPVSISWSERMKYQGRENRAVFWGDVHAASASTTTFDCAQLEAEFADAVVEPSAQPAWKPWWTLAELIDRLAPGSGSSAAASRDRRLAKEVTSLLATGHAVALTSELDPETGAVLSRARIAGPRLSVNLRAGASKMLIEGPGSLLLEDYRPEEPPPGSQVEDPNRFLASGGGGTTPARAVSGQPTRAEPRGAAAHPADGGQAVATGRRDGALFSAGSGSGPSNTLIEWQDSMWYDFSIRQTRFEGDVKLKYFSGPALARLRQGAASLGSGDGGRATFLSCDVLKVDFQLPDAAASQRRGNRLGGLRSDRLRQFEATGSVSLQDSTENLYVTADRVVYWKDSELLGIFAHGDRRAHISKKPPGQLPNQVSVKRMFYNLRTGELEAAKPAMDAR
ncbi:MAG: hypothetical protein ACE5EX_09505, partial [Phycisphaerae bacterium]